MNLTTMIGIFTVSIFLVLSLLHIDWARRGQRAGAAVIPSQNGKPLFAPSPALTLLVALALLLCALLGLGALGLWRLGLPGWLFKIGIWGVALAFALRAIGDFRHVGFFKQVRNTPFAHNDTRFYLPLCVWIALSCTLMGAFAA